MVLEQLIDISDRSSNHALVNKGKRTTERNRGTVTVGNPCDWNSAANYVLRGNAKQADGMVGLGCQASGCHH